MNLNPVLTIDESLIKISKLFNDSSRIFVINNFYHLVEFDKRDKIIKNLKFVNNFNQNSIFELSPRLLNYIKNEIIKLNDTLNLENNFYSFEKDRLKVNFKIYPIDEKVINDVLNSSVDGSLNNVIKTLKKFIDKKDVFNDFNCIVYNNGFFYATNHYVLLKLKHESNLKNGLYDENLILVSDFEDRINKFVNKCEEVLNKDFKECENIDISEINEKYSKLVKPFLNKQKDYKILNYKKDFSFDEIKINFNLFKFKNDDFELVLSKESKSNEN